MCQSSLPEGNHVSSTLVVFPTWNCNLFKVSVFRGQSDHFFARTAPALSTPDTHRTPPVLSSHHSIRASMKRSNPSREQTTSITCPTTSKENQPNHCVGNYLCGCTRYLSKENSSATNLLNFQTSIYFCWFCCWWLILLLRTRLISTIAVLAESDTLKLVEKLVGCWPGCFRQNPYFYQLVS